MPHSVNRSNWSHLKLKNKSGLEQWATTCVLMNFRLLTWEYWGIEEDKNCKTRPNNTWSPKNNLLASLYSSKFTITRNTFQLESKDLVKIAGYPNKLHSASGAVFGFIAIYFRPKMSVQKHKDSRRYCIFSSTFNKLWVFCMLWV